MSQQARKTCLFIVSTALIAVVLSVCGCSTKHYKAEADRETYKIIEQKWDPNFGSKVNYRISDVNNSPNDIIIDINEFTSGVITLPQAVAISTANNRNYQTQKENLYLTALSLTLSRHNFARQWFGTIDSRYTKQDETDKMNMTDRFGFSQLLADGTQISMDIALSWTELFIGSPDTSLGSVLSATISRPLLRGAGRKIVREELTQAERDVLYEIRSFNRFRKSFVVSVISEYYKVLQARDQVTNAENNFERREESKKRLEIEAKYGRRDRFELDQALQEWLRAENSLVRAKQSYQQQLDEFKITLALPVEVNITLDPNALKQLRQTGIEEMAYSVDQAVETALISRLDLANSADFVDDAARTVMVAEDALGADLDLIAGASVPSAGGTNYNNLRFKFGEYYLGLNADLPFDRKRERNDYRRALISYTRQQRQYELDRENVILEVRQAYRQLKEASERYKIQEKSLELAEQRVKSTNMLLKEGRATTRDLLESQDALLEAENNLTAALVDYTIAKLNFFKNIEVLQVKPDGMWQEGQWSRAE
ncbi:MAG: TolC family protein [Sedimentisphaerales bacterium]|nr:TolC family protein [Sedimentisphaerales bacterium]